MPQQATGILDWVLRRLIGQVRFADPERLRQLHQLRGEGVLVYVHRSRNVVDVLCLWQALRTEGLPLAAFVGGVVLTLVQALGLLWRGRLPADAPQDPVAREEFLLQQAVREGQAAMLFLRRPLTLTSSRPSLRASYVQALIAAQRQLDRPIFLVPQLLTFGQRPGHFTPTLGDTVFGSPEEPGLLRALVRLLLRRDRTRLLVGEPLNLQRFVEQHPEATNATLTKKVRWMLLHYLAREDRVHNGPPLKSPARMRTEALRDPGLRRTVAALVQRQGLDADMLQQRARSIYDELAARFDISMINAMDAVLRQVFSRIYDGIVVPPEDMDRIRAAMRRAPVVLVPSHRSHVDYLVLSQLMAHHGLIPPHIAAGANLSFWPLGAIFRRAGAYFIRRTFKGDPLYVAVMHAYLRKLVREGFTQEFFIEGTRSRTGKSLPPRLGLLGMLVDAFLESTQRDLEFVPIGIGYEKVIEEREYERELAGASKQKESVGGLLKATGVLRSRYGRVYVTVHDPISLRAYFLSQGVTPEDHSQEERRDVVTGLGLEIVRRIDRVTPVTPTALAAAALLGHTGPALSESSLRRYVARMLHHIGEVTAGDARLSPALQDVDAAMRQALGRLVDEGLVIAESTAGEVQYRLVRGRRPLLHRYKNNILHFFVPESIVATALAASTSGSKPTPRRVVLQRSEELVRLLRREFMLPADAVLHDFLDATVERALRNGLLGGDTLRLSVPTSSTAQEMHRFVGNLLSPYIESYWIAMRTCARLGPELSRKDLVVHIRDDQRDALLAGEIFAEEAVSKVMAESAVGLLEDLGALGPGPGRPLQFGEGWGPERVVAVADALSRYLPA